MTDKFLDYTMNSESLIKLQKDSFDIIKNKKGNVFFACGNPHSFVVADSDPEFKKALCDSSYLVSDGVGVFLAGKLFKLPVGPRITGHDYFMGLLSELENRSKSDLGRKGRVFFFGSSQHVLDLIKAKIQSEYKGIEICGMLSPPYGDWSESENNKMIDEINRLCPDVLWVGMTAPKQEKWINKNRYKLDVSVVGAIGAVFDFYAGTVKRSPQWICKLGLEWLPRLLREPRRLFKRNFVSTPLFLLMVVKFRLGKG